VGVHQSNIARLEHNGFNPTVELIQAVALHTDFPLGFFSLDSGPEFPVGTLLFRKKSSLRSVDRDRLVQLARLSFELLSIFSRRFKVYDLRIPRLSETPSLAAKVTRAALGFSADSPLPNILQRL